MNLLELIPCLYKDVIDVIDEYTISIEPHENLLKELKKIEKIAYEIQIKNLYSSYPINRTIIFYMFEVIDFEKKYKQCIKKKDMKDLLYYTCVCGSKIRPQWYNRHVNTNKHRQYKINCIKSKQS